MSIATVGTETMAVAVTDKIVSTSNKSGGQAKTSTEHEKGEDIADNNGGQGLRLASIATVVGTAKSVVDSEKAYENGSLGPGVVPIATVGGGIQTVSGLAETSSFAGFHLDECVKYTKDSTRGKGVVTNIDPGKGRICVKFPEKGKAWFSPNNLVKA